MRFITLCLLFACTSSQGPQDAGIQFDMGPTPYDAAPVHVDGNVDGGVHDGSAQDPCTFSLAAGHNDACLPACRPETYLAVIACEDEQCANGVIARDPTPIYDFDAMEDTELLRNVATRAHRTTNGCNQCVNLTTYACWYRLCPEETRAYFDCMGQPEVLFSACQGQIDTLTECMGLPAHNTPRELCRQNEVARCF